MPTAPDIQTVLSNFSVLLEASQTMLSTEDVDTMETLLSQRQAMINTFQQLDLEGLSDQDKASLKPVVAALTELDKSVFTHLKGIYGKQQKALGEMGKAKQALNQYKFPRTVWGDIENQG